MISKNLNPIYGEQYSLFGGTTRMFDFQMDIIDSSYYRVFRDQIFPAIDIAPFEVLYSSNPSRPSCNVDVLIGSIILGSIENCPIYDIWFNCCTNFCWRYALNIAEDDRAPFCIRTLTRFMTRIREYMDHTSENGVGSNPIKAVFDDLTKKLLDFSHIDNCRLRVDSTLIPSYIRKLSRFELMYCCNYNLAFTYSKKGFQLPEECAHYLEKGDRNTVCYHNKSTVPYTERAASILSESVSLLSNAPEALHSEKDYQILERALHEQACQDEDGRWVFRKPRNTSGSDSGDKESVDGSAVMDKTDRRIAASGSKKETSDAPTEGNPSAPKQNAVDGDSAEDAKKTGFEDAPMTSRILQNPADPEATFRYKYEGQSGYAVFWAEAAKISEAEDGSQRSEVSYITYYQTEQNIYSDEAFLTDMMEGSLKNRDDLKRTVTVIGDGAFVISEELAAECNAIVCNTNLLGRKPDAFLSGFQLSEDRKAVTACPMGNIPVSNSYNEKTNRITSHFAKGCCEHCPHKETCRVKEQKKLNKVELSPKTVSRAEQMKYRDTDEFKKDASFRNGTEALPSLMKNRYGMGRSQRRGLTYRRIESGFVFMAINVKRHCMYVMNTQKSKSQGISAPKTA